MSGRVTASRVAELTGRLDTTDLAIIEILARVRVATGAQLHRVLNEPAADRARQLRRRLARLSEKRLVIRLERQIGGVKAGSSGFVYALDVAGQRLAGLGGPAGGTRLRRPWTPGPMFLRHSLAITDCYVELVMASRDSDAELVSFATEPHCWRDFIGRHGQRTWCKPDAHVTVGLGEYELTSVIEVDLGTEGTTALARKFDRYIDLYQSGTEQRRSGVFPRVIWLAESDARVEMITEVAARLDPTMWQLFVVGRLDHVAELVLRPP